MTALQKLRERLKESRAGFAARIGKSESLIEKYESEPSAKLYRELADISAKEGLSDLVAIFESLADEDDGLVDPNRHRTATQTPDERAFLKACLDIYQTPKNDAEKCIPAFIWGLTKLRTAQDRKK